MKYTRLCQGVSDKGLLVPHDQIDKYIKNKDTEWYASVFYYTEEQFKEFQKKRSVAGMTGLLTDKLVFDLDSASNVEECRENTIELVTRLLTDHHMDEDNIQIYYSGNKGFHVIVRITSDLTAQELKRVCLAIGYDLPTLDTVIYNDNRILRIANTLHTKTNLYKIPLTFTELQENVVADIIGYAEEHHEPKSYGVQHFNPAPFLKVEAKKENKQELFTTIDWQNKPKEWKNCKYSLLQGYYPEGKRNEALMVIISTCKALGYDKETAYYLGKSSLKKREARDGLEFSKDELWTNVVDTIYSPTWTGGQYTCKSDGWLHDYCQALGAHKCSHDEDVAVSVGAMSSLFQDYADNYNENVLTTGIEALDENRNCRFLVGTFNGIVAAPGAGKSTLSLQILEHLSSKGIDCLFFSYDMFHSLVYTRMVQRATGLNQEEIFRIFTSGSEQASDIRDLIQNTYKNVHFCFQQGQTVDDIYETLKSTEAAIGRKIKMIIIDYNELVASKFPDPVQAGSEVAQRLRQLSHDHHVCVISLLQPSKMYSNPADDMDTYKSVKGATTIAQAMSLMLGISRPGFNPRDPMDDNYLCVSALKNRGGSLFSIDLHWDGMAGQVRSLSYEEKTDLMRVRRERDERLEEKEKEWS